MRDRQTGRLLKSEERLVDVHEWLASYNPLGRPGSLLWVRETFQLLQFHTDWESGHVDDWEHWDGKLPSSNPHFYKTVYRADGHWPDHPDDRGFPWRPSVQMPRWASRLTLVIEDVRAERVGQLSSKDAFAEGLTLDGSDCPHARDCSGQCRFGLGCHEDEASNMAGGKPWRECGCIVDRFRESWDADHKWATFDSNPWVWVTTFKVNR